MTDTTFTDSVLRLTNDQAVRLDRVLLAAKGGQRRLDQNDVLWALTIPGYREAVFPPCYYCGSPELHDLTALDVCPAYEAAREAAQSEAPR